MPKRKILLLSDQAAALLPQLAGKYHHQGEYVSGLIEEAGRRAQGGPAIAQLAELEQAVARLRSQLQIQENTP